jgi:hypothetical protein
MHVSLRAAIRFEGTYHPVFRVEVIKTPLTVPTILFGTIF